MLDHEMRTWAAKDDGGIVGETVRVLETSQSDGLGNRAEPSFRGERWIAYARTLGRLAGVSRDQGRRDEARLLQLAALRVGLEATDIQDQTSPQFADFADQFIDLLQEQGELPLCQSLAHEMVLLRRRDFGPKHPSFAAGLEKLAQVLWARGDHTQATLLLEKAVAIRRAAQGDAHPDLGDIQYRLAMLHRDRGELDEARQVLVEALDQYESFVFSAVPFLPERERLALLARFSRTLSAYLDFSTDDPRQVEEAYRRLLAWKGTATAVATAQRASMATPELRAASEELGRVRDELNRLYYAQVPPERAIDHARRLREELARRSELESRLARSIGWSRRPIRVADVTGALPPGSALVDLFRYMHHVPATDREIQARNQPPFITSFRAPPTEGPGLRFEAHYVAFVIRPGERVTRVDLGRAELIDRAVLAMVDEIENDRDFAESARRLSRDAWEPLATRLVDADWILIAPDGALSFLPWGALPGRRSGAYLLEEHGFGLITAARQLVETPPGRPRDATRHLLAVGGVDYDGAESGDVPAPVHAEAGAPLLASATLRAGAFAGDRLKVDRLPGTLAEAQQVSDVFQTIGPGRLGAEAIRFEGARATKARVRSAMAEKSYLHLATHGYFAGPKFASALAPGTLKVAGRSLDGADRSELHGLYPGLLSGLVWAGANRPELDPVTGAADLGGRIMTAEEVAGLDLRNCELAVLSACETGRGQVAGGEGVIGLQRAFHEAGARRVVASLWKVDDEATRALMERFYTFLWRDRLDPMQALHAAQLETLRGGNGDGMSRELGRPESSRASRIRASYSPRLWAAWLISGRPGGDPSGSIRWHPSLQPDPRRFLGFDRRSVPVGAALLATLLAIAILARRRIGRGPPRTG
jgi:CHAT domain-containing protein